MNLPQETLDTVLADWSDKQIEDAAMLSVPGLTPPEPRVAAWDFVRRSWDLCGPHADEPPPELETDLTKVARSVYKVVDEELDALRQAGWVDEAIFDVTVVGAMSAATVGLDSLFAARHTQ